MQSTPTCRENNAGMERIHTGVVFFPCRQIEVGQRCDLGSDRPPGTPQIKCLRCQDDLQLIQKSRSRQPTRRQQGQRKSALCLFHDMTPADPDQTVSTRFFAKQALTVVFIASHPVMNDRHQINPGKFPSRLN